MAEQETPNNATGGGQQPDQGSDDRTFTQEDVNRIAGDARAAERKKYADYDDLKDAAVLIWRVITGGNDHFIHDTNEVIYSDILFPTLFLKHIDDYSEYTQLLSTLLSVFEGNLTTAYDIMQQLQ